MHMSNQHFWAKGRKLLTQSKKSGIFRSRYSKMNQVKFVEDSL